MADLPILELSFPRVNIDLVVRFGDDHFNRVGWYRPKYVSGKPTRDKGDETSLPWAVMGIAPSEAPGAIAALRYAREQYIFAADEAAIAILAGDDAEVAAPLAVKATTAWAQMDEAIELLSGLGED